MVDWLSKLLKMPFRKASDDAAEKEENDDLSLDCYHYNR